MSLSRAQHGLYRQEFAAVLAVDPDADRLAMHAELGLPESRKDWTNDHMDEWLRACRALSEPWNMDAQLRGLTGKARRCVWVIRDLMGRHDWPEGYVFGIAGKMGMAGAEVPLEARPPEALEKLIVALRLQARRGEPGKPGKPPIPRARGKVEVPF